MEQGSWEFLRKWDLIPTSPISTSNPGPRNRWPLHQMPYRLHGQKGWGICPHQILLSDDLDWVSKQQSWAYLCKSICYFDIRAMNKWTSWLTAKPQIKKVKGTSTKKTSRTNGQKYGLTSSRGIQRFKTLDWKKKGFQNVSLPYFLLFPLLASKWFCFHLQLKSK